jgi:hypothetical protein
MDFGKAKFILSKKLNLQLLVVRSERHVGFVYKYHKRTTESYVCASGKKLGKMRTITVRDGRIVGE